MMRSIERAARAVSERPRLALFALGVALLAPSLLFGVGPSPDLEVHYAWARAFSDALAAGDPYPRWLDETMYGLGTPAFYFYPPLAYYVCALVNAVTFGLLPTTCVIAFASLAFLVGAGLAMHAWLRRRAVSPLPAFVGAAVFMAAPYHLLIDHYYRGAFGEFAAYMFVPLIAAALEDVRAGARFGLARLAVAYAGLIYCHMPTALLVSLLMIPAYVGFLAFACRDWPERLSFLARAAFAGACALALAAPYLLPALSLQQYITPEGWSIDPQTYLPLRPDLWRDQRVLFFTGLASVVAGWLVLGGGLAWLMRRGAASPQRGEGVFWAAAAAAFAALVLGVVPWFWSLPVIERVQFPMRLMPVVEFAAITAAAAAFELRRPGALRVVLVACALSLWGVGVFSAYAARNIYQTFTTLPGWIEVQRERMFDASEYLPAGFFEVGVRWYEEPLAAARSAPLAMSVEPGAAVRADAAGPAAIRIEADPAVATRIVVRRFYFPCWVVERERDGAVAATAPYGDLRLVSFAAAPGETYLVRRAMLPVERQAWLWFGLGAAALLASLAAALWRPRARSGAAAQARSPA